MFQRRAFLRHSLAFAGLASLSTALTGCAAQPKNERLSEVRFDHGVASGDPMADAVMLWTRAVPTGNEGRVYLVWELAEDRDFERLIRSGDISTDRDRDYTAKVDVRDLNPGGEYFFRFRGASGMSPIGRAKLLPIGPIEQLRLAVFSCANYPAGYFHAYAEASRLQNLDASVHLGDYIYEYGDGGYATDRASELGREFAPDNRGELFSLTDYRKRYALYRSDPDLQAVHAAAPMIVVWDDHEIANDSWAAGAQNHSADEGDYDARLRAAVQAFFEWMPLRPIVPDPQGRIYRSFDFGDLLSLHMLDTRIIGRDEPLKHSQFIDEQSGGIDGGALGIALEDAQRKLLGEQQWDWLAGQLRDSPGQWQLLGQQTVMARMAFPESLRKGLFVDHDFPAVEPLMEELVDLRIAANKGEVLSADDTRRLEATIPYNLDAWDGYPLERDRLYDLARTHHRPLIVLSGDTHNSWFSRLVDREGAAVGFELATPGVSSPGMESYLGFGLEDAEQVERAFEVLIDELEFCELTRRGYLELNLSRDSLLSTWHLVSDVTQRDFAMTSHSEELAAAAFRHSPRAE